MAGECVDPIDCTSFGGDWTEPCGKCEGCRPDPVMAGETDKAAIGFWQAATRTTLAAIHRRGALEAGDHR